MYARRLTVFAMPVAVLIGVLIAAILWPLSIHPGIVLVLMSIISLLLLFFHLLMGPEQDRVIKLATMIGMALLSIIVLFANSDSAKNFLSAAYGFASVIFLGMIAWGQVASSSSRRSGNRLL